MKLIHLATLVAFLPAFISAMPAKTADQAIADLKSHDEATRAAYRAQHPPPPEIAGVEEHVVLPPAVSRSRPLPKLTEEQNIARQKADEATFAEAEARRKAAPPADRGHRPLPKPPGTE
jgi:hypothetical protein